MHTFRKEERLSNKKKIRSLFSEGYSFIIFPIKITWKETKLDCHYPVQVLINVSQHNFRKAVDRNILKRRMREAYRKNKHLLYEPLILSKKQYALSLVYIGKNIADYQDIETIIITTIQRLIKEYEKNIE